MQKRYAPALMLVALMMAGIHLAAQANRPDFSGTWRATAVDGKKLPKPTTLQITQTPAQVTVTENELALPYPFDGSKTTTQAGPEPPANSPGGRPTYVTSAKWTQSKLVLTTESTNGDVGFSTIDTYTLGANGKTLTREQTATISRDPDKPIRTRTEYAKTN